jgi:hypothetical protein
LQTSNLILDFDFDQHLESHKHVINIIMGFRDMGCYSYTLDFPIIEYANDTLLIMEACPQQLLVLKAILNIFADSTSLKVNYSKSNMIPINMSQERLNHLVATFNCQAGSLLFTYLGLPLSNSKPTIQE